jgi:hypothetical protein
MEEYETEIDFNTNNEVIITELFDLNEEDVKSTSSGSIEYLVDEPIISYRNVKSASDLEYTNESENDNEADTFQYIYTNNEYYNEDFVKNPLVRGITLSKWPRVGFGFKVNRCAEKKFYYINEIVANSPAESCLSIGDLIVELDEFDNPFEEFSNLNEIEDYLNKKENIHLISLENSNYLKFKLNSKSLKNYSRNCEDIVIVSWNQLQKETN